MLYFPLDFGELTLDGLIDTGAHSSAIPEADLRKIRLLAPQSSQRGTCPIFPDNGNRWQPRDSQKYRGTEI